MNLNDQFKKALDQSGETQTKEEAPKKEDNGDIDFFKTQISSLSNQIESLQAANKTLLEKISFNSESKTKESDDEDDDIFEDDDGKVSLEALEAKVEKKVEKKIEKRFEERDQKDMTRQWNAKADLDFAPYGFNDTNSKFHREVKSYYNQSGDRRPSAIYDAAARVLVKGMQEGWLKPKASEVIRDYKVGNSFSASASTTKNSKDKENVELTRDDYKAMSAWGLDEKKYKQMVQAGGSRGARAAKEYFATR